MIEKGRISSFQAFLLLTNLVAATEIMFVPATASLIAGRDAWLAPAVGGLLPGIYQAFIIGALGARFPGKNLFQYLPILLTKWPGKIIGIIYILFLLETNSLIIREFGELLGGTIMPLTPIIMFIIVLLTVCAYTLRKGLEVLARTAGVLVPFIIISFLAVILMAARIANPDNLLPVLENGSLPVIRASVTPFGWRGELIVLAMIFPYLAKREEGRRTAVLTQLALAFIIGINAIATTAVFGEETSRLVYPTYSLIREVGGASFRFDALGVIVWITSLYGKIALFYYVTVLGTAQIFGLKNYRVMVMPIGVILAALSILTADNVRDLVAHISKIWPLYAVVFEYLIPTVLLLIAFTGFRSKDQNKKGA